MRKWEQGLLQVRDFKVREKQGIDGREELGRRSYSLENLQSGFWFWRVVVGILCRSRRGLGFRNVGSEVGID